MTDRPGGGEELREKIADALEAYPYFIVGRENFEELADVVLALPEIARALTKATDTESGR